MRDKHLKWLLVTSVLAAAVTAWAAAPSETAAPATEAEPEEAVAAEPEALPSASSQTPAETSPAASPASPASTTPQRFVPSEEVRADFDVSFPIDI